MLGQHAVGKDEVHLLADGRDRAGIGDVGIDLAQHLAVGVAAHGTRLQAELAQRCGGAVGAGGVWQRDDHMADRLKTPKLCCSSLDMVALCSELRQGPPRANAVPAAERAPPLPVDRACRGPRRAELNPPKESGMSKIFSRLAGAAAVVAAVSAGLAYAQGVGAGGPGASAPSNSQTATGTPRNTPSTAGTVYEGGVKQRQHLCAQQQPGQCRARRAPRARHRRGDDRQRGRHTRHDAHAKHSPARRPHDPAPAMASTPTTSSMPALPARTATSAMPATPLEYRRHPGRARRPELMSPQGGADRRITRRPAF